METNQITAAKYTDENMLVSVVKSNSTPEEKGKEKKNPKVARL